MVGHFVSGSVQHDAARGLVLPAVNEAQLVVLQGLRVVNPVDHNGLHLDSGPVDLVQITTDEDLVADGQDVVHVGRGGNNRRAGGNRHAVDELGTVGAGKHSSSALLTSANSEALTLGQVLSQISACDGRPLSVAANRSGNSVDFLHRTNSSAHTDTSGGGQIIEHDVDNLRSSVEAQSVGAASSVAQGERSSKGRSTVGDQGVLDSGAGTGNVGVVKRDGIDVSTAGREGLASAGSRVLQKPDVPLVTPPRSVNQNRLASPAPLVGTRVLLPGYEDIPNRAHLLELQLEPACRLVEVGCPGARGARKVKVEASSQTGASLLGLGDDGGGDGSSGVRSLHDG